MTPEEIQALPNVNDSRAIAAHYLAHVQDEKAHVGEVALDAFDERFSRNEKRLEELSEQLAALSARGATSDQTKTAPQTSATAEDTH